MPYRSGSAPRSIDLSADVGESFGAYTLGNDEQLLEHLSSANVACGFHAGDPRTMATAVRQCRERAVAIGAQPGFPDLVGFGRRAIEATPEQVRTDVLYQVGALHAFAVAAGSRLQHVSPHGRLGNLVVEREEFARPVAEAIESFDPELIVLTYPGVLARLARERGLRVAVVAFPDRQYEDDGTLASRSLPGAVIHDPAVIVQRALRLALTGQVESRHGNPVQVDPDSLLLHGDNAASVDSAQQVRQALTGAGVRIAPLAEVLAAGPASSS